MGIELWYLSLTVKSIWSSYQPGKTYALHALADLKRNHKMTNGRKWEQKNKTYKNIFLFECKFFRVSMKCRIAINQTTKILITTLKTTTFIKHLKKKKIWLFIIVSSNLHLTCLVTEGSVHTVNCVQCRIITLLLTSRTSVPWAK